MTTETPPTPQPAQTLTLAEQIAILEIAFIELCDFIDGKKRDPRMQIFWMGVAETWQNRIEALRRQQQESRAR